MKFMCFFLPALPATDAERMIDAGRALAETNSDIRRQMDTLNEAGTPEWFVWQGDQGLLPIEEVKRNISKVGEEILPHCI